MPTVVVVGASGKIGRRLVRLLAERGDEVRAVVRRPEQADEMAALGGTGVLLDLERTDVEGMAAVVRGADAVVFTAGAGAGSGPERKRTVDLGGSVLLAEGAALAGVERFVQVSAAGVDRPVDEDADPSWRAYVEAKAEADTRLRATDLDWTILRPGPLTDDPGVGAVTLSAAGDAGEVTRDDVAALVVACLDEAATIGVQWGVAGGGELLDEAVQDAARSQAPPRRH
ncbi:SDR family oxidoreductase [Cellulomonas endophytica]|uniref:SDR family oxidoreductase n=1 Tax=Cellulomonas endophytica TaxID=2494735 RepID=UPI001010D9BE|nr:SDR family oxidoreductase [Cellulomonas endophytica]